MRENLVIWWIMDDSIESYSGPLGPHHLAAIERQGYCEIGLSYVGSESVIRKMAGRNKELC